MVRNALDAARAAGVRKFVHVAPVYSYGLPQTPLVPESQPHVPNTRKGRFRLEQELAVLERHGGDFATLVVHLPDFYGPHADLSYANAFMREALAGKTASWIDRCARCASSSTFPMPEIRCSASRSATPRTGAAGTSADAASRRARSSMRFSARSERRRSIVRFPGSFSSGRPRHALHARGRRDVYLFESGFSLDDGALQQLLGGYEKTPFAQGIAETVSGMRR